MRILVFSAIAIAAALCVPALIRDNPDLVQRFVGTGVAEPSHDAVGPENSEIAAAGNPTGPLSGRSVRIPAGRGGHFFADFRLNGRNVHAVVDTGATLVAINESTARRIGLKLTPADFKYSASTANGTTRAASARIEEIQIGRVRLENVDAAVLRDEALSEVLVGMSFMKRLSHYEVADGALVLQQ